MRPVRLAYLVTHPIQYQAPLLRRIAAEPDIDLTVLFESDFSLKRHVDKGFGREIAWDVKLLDGYRHRFLRPFVSGTEGRSTSFWWPLSADLGAMLRSGSFDALWVHGYNSANHLAALALARRRGMQTMIRDDTSGMSRRRSALRMAAKRRAFAVIDRLVGKYLATGTSNAQHWKELGIEPDKIVVMPYAVDGNLFSPSDPEAAKATRRRFGLDSSQLLILFSAKLQDRKRPLDLLQAYCRLQKENVFDAALIFAGDGELMPALRREAVAASNVHFAGFQTQRQLAGLYQAADVMVLPSDREPWGLVVNEAMYGGCAIIASDRVGAAPDLVRDNGIVYPAGDVAALTDALRRVLGNRSRLAAMQQRSREIIAQWSFEQDVQALRMALDLPPRG